jgi:hypothetical protein
VKKSTDGAAPLRYGARWAGDTDDPTDPAWTPRVGRRLRGTVEVEDFLAVDQSFHLVALFGLALLAGA